MAEVKLFTTLRFSQPTLFKMFLLVKITRKPFFILFYYFTWCFAFPTVTYVL